MAHERGSGLAMTPKSSEFQGEFVEQSTIMPRESRAPHDQTQRVVRPVTTQGMVGKLRRMITKYSYC